MTIERYADYVRDLRVLFAELDREPERFQTFAVHIELAAAGKLVVYETRRQKGQTDSLYYGRSGPDAPSRQMAQGTAFAAIDHFMALGQFVAFDGDREGGDERPAAPAVGADYPSCAVSFAYRKKGQAMARAMFMIFVGFNDDKDAEQYAAALPDPSVLVARRPLRSGKMYEWK